MTQTQPEGKFSAMTRRRPLLSLRPVLALALAAAVLQGCGNVDRDGMATGSIANDYRLRHPISLAEVEHTLDLPVASGDQRMILTMTDTVSGFVQDYRKRSSGVFRVEYPAGAANSAAAYGMRRDIRRLLTQAGVPAPRIVETSYQTASSAPAPIRLSYVATTAMTNECGQWPEDIANNTMSNENWYNFGCASQNNLAAQLDNPMDLVAPRAMTPIDAQNRTKVIQIYRGQGKTSNN
ncbi:MAG: pilus assembly protein [Rhizobiales bacterium 63-7]|nr:MAG: pilus assembly protein [Rhizobiales bacterium 63-7]